MKKKMVMFSVSMLVGSMVLFSGCGSTSGGTTEEVVEESAEEADDEQSDDDEQAEDEAEPEEEADEEEPDTGDASLDDPRNEDEIGEKELLVTSFGTSYNDSRRLTIGAVEEALAESEPDYSVRRAFTSQMIIDHVNNRDNVKIDNVGEALNRAVDNGVKLLAIQPTHLMDGLEYHDLVEEVSEYADSFDGVAVGAPLLSSDDDFTSVAQAMADATADYRDGETAICFMGHGTEAASNGVYERMQQVMESLGQTDIFIGTVEATPTLDDILAKVEAGDYKRVVLRPMMVVAGDHANNDMAGDDDDSWKSVFASHGYDVECVLEGLAQIPEIRSLYAQHAEAAIATFDDVSDGKAGNLDEVLAAARASDEAALEEVMKDAVMPADLALDDGEYSVDVALSGGSGRTSITTPATLIVEGDSYTARIEWSSENYDYMLVNDEKYDRVNESGNSVFEIPVLMFDAPMAVVADTTAMSQPYEIDYELTFDSASISGAGDAKKNE